MSTDGPVAETSTLEERIHLLEDLLRQLRDLVVRPVVGETLENFVVRRNQLLERIDKELP